MHGFALASFFGWLHACLAEVGLGVLELFAELVSLHVGLTVCFMILKVYKVSIENGIV